MHYIYVRREFEQGGKMKILTANLTPLVLTTAAVAGTPRGTYQYSSSHPII